MSAETKIAGAVLAAGSGTRMGTPKAELVVDGSRLVDRATAALTDGGCDSVMAVVRQGTNLTGARAVVNPHPEDGLRSSLALAVEAVLSNCDALLVLLVDMPGVGADAVAAVAAGWTPGRIALARYESRSGHPIAMSVELWRRALDLAEPDEGARNLLLASPELVDEIPVNGNLFDLDTEADLERWNSRT